MTDRSVRVRLTASVSDFNRAILGASATTKAFASQLDAADSRMSNIVQTALALGPALVPIGAAAVPALSGLTAQLAAAGAAAGVSLLAFNGVGDALDALNKAQLEPTAANIEDARQAFEEIGPAAQQFVVFLDSIEPQLERLQTTASNGLLPGVQEGITELLELGPQARDIIDELATTSGDLFAEAGDNLNDPRWRDFFSFIEAEARPALLDLGRTAGNTFEGLAEMLMAFDPLSDDFSDWLLESTRSFSDWAAGLGQSQGFQEFVDYIQTNGPRAGEALGAIGNALLQLTQAAAPVGEVALPAIEAVADALALVADSPAGPVLIATAAGVSALSRAVALYNAANGSALLGMLGGVGGKGKAAGVGARAAAAGLGVLALQMTDIDDKMGLANTATFAMLGAIAGPWGAAIGGGIGLARDFATANDDLADALDNATEASASPFEFDAQRQAIAGIRAEVGELEARYEGAVGSLGAAVNPLNDLPAKIKVLYGDAIGELDRAEDRAIDLQAELQHNQVALADFFHELETGRPAESTTDIVDDLKRINEIAAELGPVLDELGIDPDVITDPTRKGWDEAMAAIRRYMAEQDSVPGRTRDVAQAFDELDSALASTEDKADALATALDELLGPALDADEALVEWKRSLATLNEELEKGRATLNVNTKAGQDHRDSIRERVEALATSIKADAKAGASAGRLADKLRQGRRAILDQAEAAGFSREKVAAYLDTLNLTPKLVQTVFRALGISRAEQQTRNLRDRYNGLPKDVRTELKALGGDISRRDVQRLKREYDLTPKQVRTILEAIDRAGGKIDFVKARLRDLDGSRADPTADLNDQASPSISTVANKLNSLDGQTARTTVVNTTVERTVHVVEGRNNTPIRLPEADGGVVDFYADGGMREKHIAQIAPAGAWRVWAEPETGGEAYIPLAPSKRERSIDIWREVGDRLGVQFREFAEGGIAYFANGGGFVGGSVPITRGYLDTQLGLVEDLPSLHEYNRALRVRARRLRDVRQARRELRREHRQSRDAAKDLRQAERALSKAESELSGADKKRARAAAREEVQEARERVRRLRKRERQQSRQEEQAEKALADAKDRHAKAQQRVSEAVREYAQQQEAAIEAARQVADRVMEPAAVFGGGFVDATSVSARLDRAIDNARDFRGVLRQLSRRGASPWILGELVAEGPSPAALHFARDLLSDPLALESINAQAARLRQISERIGSIVAQPAFLQPLSEREVNRAARDAQVYAPVNVNAPQNMDPQQVGEATAQRLVSRLVGVA